MAFTNIGSGVLLDQSSIGSGSGSYNSFLRIQHGTTESGYNTDTTHQLDNKDGTWTHSIQFSSMAIVNVGGTDYYEIRLDLNELNSGAGPNITLQDLQLFHSDAAATTPGTLGGLTKVFDLSGTIDLVDHNSGSGSDDYVFLVPTSLFTGSTGFSTSDYFTLYADFGRINDSGSPSDGGFEEFRVKPDDGPPAINIVKEASPTSIDEGTATDVTYTYTVTNTSSASTDPLTITSLIDDNGTVGTGDDFSPTYVSGDTNANGLLDKGESWIYTATVSLDRNAGTVTNTATVTGHDDENNQATDSDDATVTINDLKPVITLVKSADPTNVDEGSSNTITYTYTLTSQSNHLDPLTIDSLIDDNGTVGTGDDFDVTTSYTSFTGDTNSNGLLDSNETWVYTYEKSGVGTDMNAGDELTNTATVTAHDDEGNEATSSDDSVVTATVTADDVDPKINLEKTASPTHVNEGGAAEVTYTYTLTSDSASTDPLHLTTFVDDNGTVDTGDDVNLLQGASDTTYSDFYTGGDDNGNFLLDSNETWTFEYTNTLPSMNVGDEWTNSATVHASDDENNDTSATDDATVTVDDVLPAITLVKEADKTSINEGTPTDITYTYTLTSQSVGTDPLSFTSLVDDNGTVDTGDDVNLTMADLVSGDDNSDGLLQNDETWVFQYTAHNVTVNAGDLTNTAGATMTDDEGNDATDDAQATVTVNDVTPGIDITKVASPTQVQAGVPTSVTFTYNVTNTSTASTDPLTITSLIDDNGTSGNTSDDWTPTYVSGDANSNGLLDQGETWQYSYTSTLTLSTSTYTNIIVVHGEDDEGNDVSDSASASVSVINLGRTPGFWSNNGSLLWDGNTGTLPKAGGLGIVAAGQDLAYGIRDFNFDGVADSSGPGSGTGSKSYLMIGDWNHNGLADAGENVLLIGRTDALSLLNSSQKQQQDGRFVLARDMVASWLNTLGGSYAGNANDPNSARHYIDEATAWLMQTTTDHNHLFTVSELTAATKIAQSTSAWGQGFDFDGDTIKGENMVPSSGDVIGQSVSLDIMAGNAIHTGLDHYNNTGWVI